MPLSLSLSPTMILPSADSPLRGLFSVEDVISAKANPMGVPSLRDGLHSARKFLATDARAKSVNMIVRVSTGHVCLVEVNRQSHYYYWDFTAGKKMPRKWAPK